jgi:FkbM family methyltransferase
MKPNIYNIINNRFKEIKLLLNNNFIFNLIIYSFILFQFIPIIRKALRKYNSKLLQVNYKGLTILTYASQLQNTFGHLLYLSELPKEFMPSFGDVVVDVGASIGAFCIRSSLIVGEKGKVIAIEPEPNSFKILNTNIKINKLSNVLCLNLALSNKEGYENLHVKSDIPFWSSFKKDMVNYDKITTVKVKTLNNLFKELKLQRIDLLKIDTQGSEKEIIEGSLELLQRKLIRKIEIEIHKIDDIHYIINILRNYGYKYYIIYTDQYRILAYV